MSAHAHVEHGSTKLYTGVLLALLMLTAITVTASGVNFGSPIINVFIAMTIASIKASLVALFFMHLLWDKPINAIIFVCGLVFLAVFLIFCFIDVESRRDPIPATLKVPVPSVAPAQAPPATH